MFEAVVNTMTNILFIPCQTKTMYVVRNVSTAECYYDIHGFTFFSVKKKELFHL